MIIPSWVRKTEECIYCNKSIEIKKISAVKHNNSENLKVEYVCENPNCLYKKYKDKENEDFIFSIIHLNAAKRYKDFIDMTLKKHSKSTTNYGSKIKSEYDYKADLDELDLDEAEEDMIEEFFKEYERLTKSKRTN
jgi:hypothetical protein